MRILFVSPFYKPYLGGVERVVEKLGQEFTSQGQEVSILTTKYSFPRHCHPEWESREEVAGLEVRRLKCWPHKALPFYQVPLVWFSPFEIRQMINDVRPEVIIYMGDKWFWGNFWVRIWSPKTKHIWCPIFHDLTFWKQWLRLINRIFANMINDVVVVTNIESQKIQKEYGVAVRKVKVIPWGVNIPDVWSSLETLTGLATNSRRIVGDRNSVAEAHKGPPYERSVVRILSVGRISKHKGQQWLVNRFLEIKKLTAISCQLVLVGEVEDQKVYSEIKAAASRVGEGSIVIDTQADDERLKEYYDASTIFALFPEYESFGLAFLEAMSYGLPVITHSVGAIKEVLGEYAVVGRPYDEKFVTSSILRMINDVGYRNTLGTKGSQFVQNNYSWKKCSDEFLKLIK